MKHSEGIVEQCIMLIELIIMLSDVTWRYHGSECAVNKGREVNQAEWRVSYAGQVDRPTQHRKLIGRLAFPHAGF